MTGNRTRAVREAKREKKARLQHSHARLTDKKDHHLSQEQQTGHTSNAEATTAGATASTARCKQQWHAHEGTARQCCGAQHGTSGDASSAPSGRNGMPNTFRKHVKGEATRRTRAAPRASVPPPWLLPSPACTRDNASAHAQLCARMAASAVFMQCNRVDGASPQCDKMVRVVMGTLCRRTSTRVLPRACCFGAGRGDACQPLTARRECL